MKTRIHPSSCRAREGGYIALLTTLVLVGIGVLLMSAIVSRCLSNARLNDRNANYNACNSAAEAAVEKVLSRMLVDFDQNGESQVLLNMPLYRSKLLPSYAENSYWNNFTWSDGQGNDDRVYIARTSSGTNMAFVSLQEQYNGLSGFSSTYRILANCRLKNSTYNYQFANAVQYDLQLAQIPIFQFAIFYNGLLEFSDCAPLTIGGTVYCNSNIYVGSGSPLTFNGMVNAVGNITDPPNVGKSTSDWTAAVTYNGTPAPGYLTGQPALSLPVGTNSFSGTSVQQILYPPASSTESATSGIGAQRYYNQAGMTIWVSNQNSTPTFTLTLKNSASDANPVTFTNLTSTLTNAGYFPWLTVSSSLKDWRENKTMYLTQIDVGLLNNWMATNMYVYGSSISNVNKFNVSNTPLNIIWVSDWRYSNSLQMSAVRVTDGTTLPDAGLTLATPNPLYVQGIYNAPGSANLGSSNVNGTAPASFASDALTVLSPSWSDSASFSSSEGSQNASDDTVNAAIITGNVPSTGSGGNQFSGGVHNLPRLQESWSGNTLTLNTSLVCLFTSTWATGQFLPPSTYYSAPTRQFYFNQNYNYSWGMPPGTPHICKLIRASWCNPAPNVTDSYSQTLGFVPR